MGDAARPGDWFRIAIADVALRWTAAEPGSFQFPFLEIDRAGNWQEFTTALARFPGPGQNFVYADVDGNIGYQATGKLPIRKNYDGDVPVDGSSGDYEWDGFIPFDQLPSFYNPPQGWIITANQNPFPENYPYRVNGSFAAPYRSLEIRSALTAHEHWKPEEMLGVQKDVYSAFSRHLAQPGGGRLRSREADRAEPARCRRVLRSWNGQMEKRTAAPMLITLVYQSLEEADRRVGCTRQIDLLRPDHGAGGAWKKFSTKAAGVGSRDPDAAADASAQRARYRKAGNRKAAIVKSWNYGSYNELTHQTSGGQPDSVSGSLFQHRPGGDERLIHHHQADHADAGAVHAIRSGLGGLGSLAQQHHDRRVRARFCRRTTRTSGTRITTAGVFRCSF